MSSAVGGATVPGSRRIPSRFDASLASPAKFRFGDATSAYLTQLRSEFGLDDIVSAARDESDLERVRRCPTNAVQLADALCFNPDAVEILSMSAKAQADHVGWIEPYLHYFSAALDNRYDVERETGVVRVAPTGSSEPRVFQRVHPLPAATLFTHCPSVLYPTPA